MADSVAPPPDYTHDLDDLSDESDTSLQVLITPPTGASSFQVGHLGLQDEHTSIEGEVHVKGGLGVMWDRVAVSLNTVEIVDGREIELAANEVVPFSSISQSSSSSPTGSLPTPIPFSIPLTPDLPQSVVTPSSSVSHTLVAKLYPRDGPAVATSHQVQLERYTSPSAALISIDPVSVTDEPLKTFTAQLPRSIFRVGESIPIYVTVPPPNDSVLGSGLRLRNIMIELWRHVKLGDLNSVPLSSSVEGQVSYPSTSSEKPPPSYDGAIHSHVVTRSGSSCRFHSSRPLKMRFIIHESSAESLTSGNITQTTLLHDVSFEIQVKISFTSSVSQNASEVITRIPIVILPPLAPELIGDMNEEMDVAYHKKHDPPPARTARIDDHGAGSSRPPAFDEVTSPSTSVPYAPLSPGRYGAPPPSFMEANHQDLLAAPSTSIPPAFSDGENALGIHHSSSRSPASPPSFDDVTSTPGGAHLPSFIESQVEAQSDPTNTRPLFGYWVFNPALGREEMRFEGEGSLYGFQPSEQYDGISHSLMQSNAGADTRMTAAEAILGDGDPLRANLPALTEALAQYADVDENDLYISYVPNEDDSDLPPPPPPPMDDPSDPPPSIDEGINTLTEEARSLRERAIAEAAASAATAAVARLNLAGTSVGFPHTNPGEGGEIADLSVTGQGDGSNLHLSQEHLIPRASDDIHGEDRIGRVFDSVEAGHPPPYLGAGAQGPPPYVD